jgi:hypothetical protein
MTNCRPAYVLFLAAAWCGFGAADEGAKAGRYTSDRNANTFVGATRVVLDDFDPTDKEAKSATLQLDKNEVTFSSFGDPQITAVSYKSFPVKLTRLKIADPAGKDRRIFSVALPKEHAEALGKNSLRLVALIGTKSELPGVRLLVVNPEDKVTQTLELRPASN